MSGPEDFEMSDPEDFEILRMVSNCCVVINASGLFFVVNACLN